MNASQKLLLELTDRGGKKPWDQIPMSILVRFIDRVEQEMKEASAKRVEIISDAEISQYMNTHSVMSLSMEAIMAVNWLRICELPEEIAAELLAILPDKEV